MGVSGGEPGYSARMVTVATLHPPRHRVYRVPSAQGSKKASSSVVQPRYIQMFNEITRVSSRIYYNNNSILQTNLSLFYSEIIKSKSIFDVILYDLSVQQWYTG